jgi:hypothetical protein
MPNHLKAEQSRELVILYEDMARHTEPECANNCRLPRSCCSPEYCQFTLDYAQKEWGLVLMQTSHPTLPLMGPKGCTAPPHVRPACTLHTCSVNGFGFKPNDMPWTEKYFKIRGAIESLEIKRQFGEK